MTDLVKDTGRLLRAYDDAAGVTAEFNRNVLVVVNRELDADFAVEEFEHVALWDARARVDRDEAAARRERSGSRSAIWAWWSRSRPAKSCAPRSRPSSAARGIEAELGAAGMRTVRFWTDPDGDFGLLLAEPRLRPRACLRPSPRPPARQAADG